MEGKWNMDAGWDRMTPLQEECHVAEDDRVEIEENYGCQSSAHDLYLHVPLARGSFFYAR